ncbi:integrase [Aquamicrobium lusatiense]|uniref:Integrase n=1 Tax=Aquamicrobium lusatiense TaxID=89772 RepID=A0A7W9S1I0_9HYPH|nr:site-specific integrase [Aquamicrobium lusatiense]MBB6012366.1 integrase [Aquamicrobium lusatiense]
MPKSLTAREVEALTMDGLHRVDHGLYLQIRRGGATRSWLLRYRFKGRPTWMGLGPARVLTLTEAKRRALASQRLILDGIDPAKARKAERRPAAMTFAECAKKYVETHKAGWKNEKHIAQWTSTLETYANPVIGKLAVDQVDADHVFKILEPIWTTKTETATRLRGRLERVLDWARATGLRSGENPARWKEGLSHRLPAPGKVQRKTAHHGAVPYAEIPALMKRLGELTSISARALSFTILTAARTGETIGATWNEIDLKAKVWVIPAERMKAGKEHRVSLSDAAVALLKSLPRRGDHVFAAHDPTQPLSNMAMLQCLRGLRGGKGETVHGFRSGFSTWAAELTNHPREIVEASLAHEVGNAVELAYKRTDYLVKRAKLMKDWAAFVTSGKAKAA